MTMLGHQQPQSRPAPGEERRRGRGERAGTERESEDCSAAGRVVLLRMASDSDDRDELANPDINGDGSAIGCTPTASTMPTKTSIAAYRRWLQRVRAMPAMQQTSRAKPMSDDAPRLEVVDRRAGGEPGWIADVEQPVPEAAQRLGADRRERHRLERLRVRQHVGAMTGSARRASRSTTATRRGSARRCAVAVTVARRHVIDRCHAACSSHSTGAGAIIASAVAFGEPTVKITNAKIAASRQRLRVAARIVKPTNQPSDAHGSNISDVRDR